jgi:hypothetical protein
MIFKCCTNLLYTFLCRILYSQRPRFCFWLVLVGYVVEKLELGQCFLSSSTCIFPCHHNSIIPPYSHVIYLPPMPYNTSTWKMKHFSSFVVTAELDNNVEWVENSNSNKSPTRCNNFSVYYPDVCLQLNMFRAFSRPLSGAQWLQ